MSTSFVSDEAWPRLTKAVRASPRRCLVAVAYFGAGASRLLPLAKGSSLVVNASENAVRTGQTCPADLKVLAQRGVLIYSVGNLHAKVFVVGTKAFVGSANVSRNSANNLIEALVVTPDRTIVADAKRFVTGLCLDELGPARIKRLAEIYRPPKFSAGAPKRQGARKVTGPALPRLMLAQLHRLDYPVAVKRPRRTGCVTQGGRRPRRRTRSIRSSGSRS